MKKWKKIYDTVLEEEKSAVIIENDLEGNPISLEEFVVFLHIKANEAQTGSSYMRIGINKDNVHDFISQGGDGVPASGVRNSMYIFKRIGECTWILESARTSINTLLSPAGMYGMDFKTVTDMAEAIVLNFMVNAGVGTEIRIYGQ